MQLRWPEVVRTIAIVGAVALCSLAVLAAGGVRELRKELITGRSEVDRLKRTVFESMARNALDQIPTVGLAYQHLANAIDGCRDRFSDPAAARDTEERMQEIHRRMEEVFSRYPAQHDADAVDNAARWLDAAIDQLREQRAVIDMTIRRARG